MNAPLIEEGQKPTGNGHIYFKIKESRTHFKDARNAEGRRVGHGQFFLLINIIALQGTVYIPISLASGKKPTGFVYQIEGTAQGLIATTDISCKGDGVATVTLGTLVYAKIPQGKTATFRIVVDMTGSLNDVYKIIFSRINYKLDPSDARYKKFDAEIASKPLTFKY